MVFAPSNTSNIVANKVPMIFGDKLALQTLFGGRQDRPGRAFARILARLDAPGACQEQLWSGLWASKTRPERVPGHP